MTGILSYYEPSDAFKAGACRTISHQKRSFRQIRVDLVRRTGLKREETSFKSDRHLFVLNLKGVADNGEHFVDGKPIPFVRRKPGTILFIPAGRSWSGWETGEQSAAYLAISIDPMLAAELEEKDCSSKRALTPSLGLDDPILTHAAWRIGEEMRDKTPLTDLLIESYARTMLVQISRRRHQIFSERTTGGMSPSALNRVIEKIDADPAAALSLSQLAELAGLSIPHFCRAFKESTGCPPYAFIVQRRIERAKSYLRFSEMSVTEIALSCGFSSSSHFSNAFKKELGIAPLVFRAQ